MQNLTDIIREQHVRRPAKDDPLFEALLATLLSVAEELCVARDRLDTCQQLAASGAASDDAAIDAFEPDDAEIERRLARHCEFFEQLFSEIGESDAT